MANMMRIARKIVIGQNTTAWRGLSISGYKMNEVVATEKDKQVDLYDHAEVSVILHSKYRLFANCYDLKFKRIRLHYS